MIKPIQASEIVVKGREPSPRAAGRSTLAGYRASARVAVALALMPALCDCPTPLHAQTAAQRQIYEKLDYLLEFEVGSAPNCASTGPTDQVTILFSNQSMETDVPPASVFGEDIVAEFSFSPRDAEGDTVRFRRRVRDRSFLDARFIRVVNAGPRGWCGGTLALRMNGDPILETRLAPRRGRANDGIQNWNRASWRDCSYWEAALPGLLRPRTFQRK